MLKNNRKTIYLVLMIVTLLGGLGVVLYMVLQGQGFFESRNYAAPSDGKVDLNLESGTVKDSDSSFVISLKVYPDGNSIKSGDLSFSYDNTKLKITGVVVRKGNTEVVSDSAFIFSNLGTGRAINSGVCANAGIACLAFSDDVVYNESGSITGAVGGVVADITFEPVSGSFSSGDIFNISYIGAETNKVTDKASVSYTDIVLNNLTINVEGTTCVQDCTSAQCGDLDPNCGEVCLNCSDGLSCTEESGAYSCVEALCEDTCESLGFECGSQEICGQTEVCGTCGTGEFCNNLGLCEVEETECTDTCASLGYACGTHTVCGNSTNCGSCASGQTCNSSGVCETTSVATCTDTCASLGYECGAHTICGNSVNCGSCASGQTCNSSGVCISTPLATCTDTCASLGYECGTHTVCGNSVNCGSCSMGQTCNSSGDCVVVSSGSTPTGGTQGSGDTTTLPKTGSGYTETVFMLKLLGGMLFITISVVFVNFAKRKYS